VRSEGYKFIMTGDCPTGTDRVAEAAEHINADIFVNVQGDEPNVRPDDIRSVIIAKKRHMDCVIGTMKMLDHNNPNVVKVICNAGQLIDMTRVGEGRFAQCGMYAFSKRELYEFANASNEFKDRSLEEHENIEIMRFMDLGMKVRMIEIQGSQPVDTLEDIELVKMEVNNHGR
jgi:3-deoxy-manno-octulosonate cytidylyltransferase (CMP-KDO synthetase)